MFEIVLLSFYNARQLFGPIRVKEYCSLFLSTGIFFGEGGSSVVTIRVAAYKPDTVYN